MITSPSSRRSGFPSRQATLKRRRLRRRGARLIPLVENLEERRLLSDVNEVEPNNVFNQATALDQSIDPSGSGFQTGRGLGAVTPAGDLDYWKFTALAGDRVTIAGEGGTQSSSMYVELRNSSDSVLASANDYSGGHTQLTNFAIPSDGTYYVRARAYDSSATVSSSTLRVDVSHDFLGEAESKFSTGWMKGPGGLAGHLRYLRRHEVDCSLSETRLPPPHAGEG